MTKTGATRWMLCLLWGSCVRTAPGVPPNIVVFVADDLGWGDVSFHGSPQIPTPNIDLLAADGITLNNYYVSPLCTPSRSTLLSGRHPIHTGMQHDVIYTAYEYAFPLRFPLMPQFFKKLGYDTHAVGKWHLGHMTVDHTPTRRGFDSFYGYYSGHQGYTDHSVLEVYNTENDSWIGWGLDIWDNLEADYNAAGKYSTQLFTEKAIDLLGKRNQSKPFFLYLSHLAVHVGNKFSLLEAPDDYVERFSHIKDTKRRNFAAMLSCLDDALGELLKALHSAKAIENTILVFTTDNGGAAGGVDDSAGSNWPLRGSKATLWEGGVRGVSFIWSPLIRKPRVAHQLMHVSDWLPTLYSAAGGSVSDLGDIDGVDMWDSLLKDSASPRLEVLHNIDPIWNVSALRYGDFKYVQGSYEDGRFDNWYKPAGLTHPSTGQSSVRDNFVDKSGIFGTECAASETILALGRSLPVPRHEEVQVSCGKTNGTVCKPLLEPCLFRIDSDPCEIDNVASKYPEIMKLMTQRIEMHAKTMVPPINKPPTRKADPRNFNFTWAPYERDEDYEYIIAKHRDNTRK
uniref:Putative arylsulfatase j-like protein n=2 Tax=Ixodes ricinus TaxID=34613 RepID=V5ID93_IXORI